MMTKPNLDLPLRNALDVIASILDAWPTGAPLPRVDIDDVYDAGCAALESNRDH